MRFVVTTLALSLTVAGATLERLSLDEMTQKSTAIVRAKAVSSVTSFVGSTIYTKTQFQVLERWKGPEAATVEVSEPGGTVGTRNQNYSGVPRFVNGQEVVLFLWTGPSGRTQVIGLTQGVFQVERSGSAEEEAVREPSGEAMLAPGTGEMVRDEVLKLPLKSLQTRVKSALRGVKGQ